MIITIDTGTTNTRVALFDGKQRVDLVKTSVGVRNTSIDGHNQRLLNTIAEAVSEIKLRQKLNEEDIDAIIAAGMITSNLGLLEVPHLIAPVSLDDFANNIHSAVIPEIASQPIHFIPGVKNVNTANLTSIEGLDIMRGEEVEALAIADTYHIRHSAIIALPGSHSKFVAMDANQSILGCCTTLAGELNAIITGHTILTSSLENRYTDTLCQASLVAGYDEAERYGFGKALFSIRLNEQFGGKQHHQLASFLVGIILHSDIKAITATPHLHFTPETPVYIGGKGILCDATASLLARNFPGNDVIQCENVDDLSAMGAMYVARKAKLIS